MNDMNVVAFVAAKGNSERVPGKNMRDFAGAPLIHKIIATLTSAERVSKVVLDSDSDDILNSVAAAFPAVTLIRRPEHLCGDTVPMNALIENAFEVSGASVLLQTHATNPFLKPETVDAAVDAFFALPKPSSLMSVTPLQKRFYWEPNSPINHSLEELLPTQDLPFVYEENSNIYIVTRAAFAENARRVTDDVVFFDMKPLEAVDIDTEEDFLLAVALHQLQQGS